MKIRFGFISNSSSSSFIVAFDSIPKNMKEYKKIFLYFERAKIIRNLIEKQEIRILTPSNTSLINDIKYECSCGWLDIFNYRLDTIDKEEREFLDKWNIKYRKRDSQTVENITEYNNKLDYFSKKREFLKKLLVEEESNQFIINNENKLIYFFEFSDDRGSIECDLEHGNVFQYLNNIKISKH